MREGEIFISHPEKAGENEVSTEDKQHYAELCPRSSRSSRAAFLKGEGVERGLHPSVLNQALHIVSQLSCAFRMVLLCSILRGEKSHLVILSFVVHMNRG